VLEHAGYEVVPIREQEPVEEVCPHHNKFGFNRLKIRNSAYSQSVEREELLERECGSDPDFQVWHGCALTCDSVIEDLDPGALVILQHAELLRSCSLQTSPESPQTSVFLMNSASAGQSVTWTFPGLDTVVRKLGSQYRLQEIIALQTLRAVCFSR
jgi:hypothetical protein